MMHCKLGVVLLFIGLGSCSLHAQVTIAENSDWKAINQDDLNVKAGSALDMMAIFPAAGKAGDDGFVMTNDKGQLVFTKTPKKPIRFLCAAVDMRLDLPQDKTPEDVNRYAEQLQRAGYNCLSTGPLDYSLEDKALDGGLNPKVMDKWDKLAAALKTHGVYLFLEMVTIEKGVKAPLYYDTAAQGHWKTYLKNFLTHVNPYTGLALKDDPMVAVGSLMGHFELNSLAAAKGRGAEDVSGLYAPFRDWLRKKYGTTEALKAAWGTDVALDTVQFSPVKGVGPDTADLQLFFVDTERLTYQWMSAYMREVGLHIPLTLYNGSSTRFDTDLARDVVPLVSAGSFSEIPSGGKAKAGNPLLEGGRYFDFVATTRQLGRPFMVSEWGQAFWNPFRYQAGLTFSAYAALQGWQMIAQLSEPVRRVNPEQPAVKMPIETLRVSKDATLKAGEYMSTLLFRRGDVQVSSHTVEMVVEPKSFSEKLPMWDTSSSTVDKLPWLAGFGVKIAAWQGAAARGTYHVDLSIATEGSQKTGTQTSIEDMVKRLHAAKILSANNRTDPAKGVYESDTKQIFLDQKAGTIQIATPMSQGGSLFAGDAGLQLPDLHAKLSGADGSIFAGSLTNKPLATSSRILLMVVTDALNSGMTFTDASQHEMVNIGHPPTLMHVAQANVSVRNSAGGKAHLWALAITGERVEEIPLTVKDGMLVAHIDTGALKNGPTPYFEIVRRK